jgi:hypothetical protein
MVVPSGWNRNLVKEVLFILLLQKKYRAGTYLLRQGHQVAQRKNRGTEFI